MTCAVSAFIVVDLPAPLGPSSPTHVPKGTSRSRPSTAVREPNRLTTPRRRMALSMLFRLPTWGELIVSDDAEGGQPCPQRLVDSLGRLLEGPRAQLEIGRAPAPRLRAQRADPALGAVGAHDGALPGLHAAQHGRDAAPPEPGRLEDPVGQAGVVERLELERDDPAVGAEDEPRGLGV